MLKDVRALIAEDDALMRRGAAPLPGLGMTFIHGAIPYAGLDARPPPNVRSRP